VESCDQPAGFSEGNGEPSATVTENTDETAITNDTTTTADADDATEHTKRDSSGHAEDDEYRTVKNKGHSKHKLEETTARSKSKKYSEEPRNKCCI
jgi:hypothetical protein